MSATGGKGLFIALLAQTASQSHTTPASPEAVESVRAVKAIMLDSLKKANPSYLVLNDVHTLQHVTTRRIVVPTIVINGCTMRLQLRKEHYPEATAKLDLSKSALDPQYKAIRGSDYLIRIATHDRAVDRKIYAALERAVSPLPKRRPGPSAKWFRYEATIRGLASAPEGLRRTVMRPSIRALSTLGFRTRRFPALRFSCRRLIATRIFQVKLKPPTGGADSSGDAI